jgi:hypothetical protein
MLGRKLTLVDANERGDAIAQWLEAVEFATGPDSPDDIAVLHDEADLTLAAAALGMPAVVLRRAFVDADDIEWDATHCG